MLTMTRAATPVATARHWMREDTVAGTLGGLVPAAARHTIAPLSATVPGTTVSAADVALGARGPLTVFTNGTPVVGSSAWSPPV